MGMFSLSALRGGQQKATAGDFAHLAVKAENDTTCNLLLTRVSDEVAASDVEQGKNIESADYSDSTAERYSDYIGVSLSVTPFAGDSSAVQNAHARDPQAEKMRYRNYITIVESTLITAKREQESIDREMNRRYGRSKILSVVADSWRDSSGKL